MAASFELAASRGASVLAAVAGALAAALAGAPAAAGGAPSADFGRREAARTSTPGWTAGFLAGA